MKRLAAIFAMLMLAAVLSGCGDDLAELQISSDTYAFIPLETEQLETELLETEPLETEPLETDLDVTALAPEISESTDTASSEGLDLTANTSQRESEEAVSGTVYWVSNGEVWHTTEKCSTLSRSKNIKSGSISDAMAVGKERVCKVCG